MRRIVTVAAVALVATMGLAGPAWAVEDETPLFEEGGITVTQAACEDGGDITIHYAGTYLVSSGVRTAGIAARIGDDAWYQEPAPADNGEHIADETLVVPAPQTDGDMEVRWFAGPERADEPAWNTADHPDWADTVTELEAGEARHWNAGDWAEFTTAYTVSVEGCMAATTPPATPTDEYNCSDFDTQEEAQAVLAEDYNDPHGLDGNADGIACEDLPSAHGQGGEEDELPTTGVSTGLIAAGASALVVLGVGLFLVARRRRVTFTA